MEEIVITCLKKINKNKKNTKKAIVKLKKKHKTFLSFFSLHITRMEQKVLIFSEDYINKNAFHKIKRPSNIDEVDIRRTVLSSNKTFHLNILLHI